MSTIPKCPECDALLTANLRICMDCGWTRAPEPVPAAPSAPLETEYPRRISPGELPPLAVRKARIAELYAIVKRKPPGAPVERAKREPYLSAEVTPGHGGLCFCELCFAIRTKPTPSRQVEQEKPPDDPLWEFI